MNQRNTTNSNTANNDTPKLSHITPDGKATMVDVGAKKPVRRTAIAQGNLLCQKKTVQLIQENSIAKGDVLSVARIAAITGGKMTSQLIPLCHNIAIDAIDIDFEFITGGIQITATAKCTDKTGIEMEALTAVSLAALTIYDMCKAVDKKMRIDGIYLVQKTKEPAKGDL